LHWEASINDFVARTARKAPQKRAVINVTQHRPHHVRLEHTSRNYLWLSRAQPQRYV